MVVNALGYFLVSPGRSVPFSDPKPQGRYGLRQFTLSGLTLGAWKVSEHLRVSVWISTVSGTGSFSSDAFVPPGGAGNG